MTIEEKAVGYVLGSLSDAEREAVARERLYHSALDKEIRLTEQTYGGLQFDESDVAVSDVMWSRISGAVAREKSALATKSIEDCESGSWQVHGPGIEFKQLWSDGALMIRCNPGAMEEMHDQPADLDEHILVLAGDLVISGRVFGIGDYIRVPAGTSHQPMETRGGCLLFTEYLPPAS